MELTQDYLFKFQKHKGSLETDLIKLIAEKVNKPFMAIRQLTLGCGWDISMLKEAASLAEKNPIEFWKYRKTTFISEKLP